MKELYCITCPTGCRLIVMEQSTEFEVEGNECKRGVEFAKAEMTNPTRSLTTTVRTSLPDIPVLPVRTDGEIPKGKIMEAMRELSSVVVSHELGCGDTVLENVVGSGVRVIATSDIMRDDNRKWKIESGKSGDKEREGRFMPEFGILNPELTNWNVNGELKGDADENLVERSDEDSDGNTDSDDKSLPKEKTTTPPRLTGRSHIKRK